MPGPESGDARAKGVSLDRIVDDRFTLNDRVYGALRDAVVHGELLVGDLYSVGELAERLGVSRTPVREALVRLSGQNMVRFERNRGFRVLQTTAHDIEEIYIIRLLLEVPATFRAASRPTPETLKRLDAAFDALVAANDAPDIRSRIAADSAFHSVILRASGNSRLAEYVESLRELQMIRGTSAANKGIDTEELLGDHRAILEHVAAGDPAGAAAAMQTHLAKTLDAHIATESGSTNSASFRADWLGVWQQLGPLT